MQWVATRFFSRICTKNMDSKNNSVKSGDGLNNNRDEYYRRDNDRYRKIPSRKHSPDSRRTSLSPRGRSPHRRSPSRSLSPLSTSSGQSGNRRRLRSRSRSPQLPKKQSAVLRSLILSNISLNVKLGHLEEIIPETRIKFPFRIGKKTNTAMMEFKSRDEAMAGLKRLDCAMIDGLKVRARFMNKEDESFI